VSGPLVLTHLSSYLHNAPNHPERPERIAAIEASLARDEALGSLRTLQLEIPDEAPVPGASSARAAAVSVHEERYVDMIFEVGAEADGIGAGGWLDADTYLGPGSLEAACGALLSAREAVVRVLSGDARTAFSFCRPPGHHATRGQAMGFCFFNNIAVAAQKALDSGLDRVAIVDFDVHHGNGTQDVFYGRADVLYVSTHQWPLYPGTGSAGERGAGAGEGYTVNLPLPAGTNDDQYTRVFDETVVPALARFEPQLLLLSAGFDAHQGDPLAGMEVTTPGFVTLARRLLDSAERLCEGRSAWLLEGGYDLDSLGASAAAVVREAARGG
jgi:acetoin utilization deacetylase AcuC-like enzyme